MYLSVSTISSGSFKGINKTSTDKETDGYWTDRRSLMMPKIILLLLLAASSLAWIPDLITDESEPGPDPDRYLTIPALGRSAELGSLYDERTDHFNQVSITRKKIPPQLITTRRLFKALTQRSAPIPSKYVHKFQLLNIDTDDLNTGVNILSNLCEVEGIAGMLLTEEGLEEFIKGHDPNATLSSTGILFIPFKKVAEDFQIFYETEDKFYNTELLSTHKYATHIVTSITWGLNVAVLFPVRGGSSSSSNNNQNDQQQDNNAIYNYFNGAPSSTQQNELDSDLEIPQRDMSNPIYLSAPPTPAQITEIQSQLLNFVSKSKNNDGLIPLEFRLSPINPLRQAKNLECHKCLPVHVIQNEYLQAFLPIFDEMTQSQGQLRALESKLGRITGTGNDEDGPSTETLSKIKTFQERCFKLKKQLQSELKTYLQIIRNGSRTTSNGLLALSEIYRQPAIECSAQNVGLFIESCAGALKKIEFFNAVKNNFPLIKYFGRQAYEAKNSGPTINKNIVHILYLKEDLILNNPVEWEENSNAFLTSLYKPYNVLIALDCDFNFPQCTSSFSGPGQQNQTVIKQLINGEVTIEDVNFKLKAPRKSRNEGADGNGNENPLRIQAIGRFAQLGELYDTKTNRFLKRSLLTRPGYPTTLVHFKENPTKIGDTITEVPSESIVDKFKAFNVEPEMQFNILAQLGPLTRSGRYFKETSEGNSNSNFSRSALVHRIYRDAEELAVDTSDSADPEIPRYLANAVVEQVGPDFNDVTHYVSRIDYGFNSVFQISIESENAESQRAILEALKSILKRLTSTTNQSITLSPEELSALQNKIFTITVYSDIEEETVEPPQRLIIENTGQLLHFLNEECIPKLVVQNSCKGQPISYILLPINILREDLGLLAPEVKYQTLTSNDGPSNFGQIIDLLTRASTDVQKLSDEIQTNSDCATDQDLKTLEEIKEEFMNISKSFNQDFQQVILQIKSGKLEKSELDLYRQKFQNSGYFEANGQFKSLEKMSLFQSRLQLYQEVNSNFDNIKYLGREEVKTFHYIFMQRTDQPPTIYLLFYKAQWTQSNAGASGDAWRTASALFFGPLTAKGKDSPTSNSQFYIIDCDFNYPYCESMNESRIHEYKDGRPTSEDFVQSYEVQAEESDLQGQINNISRLLRTHLDNDDHSPSSLETRIDSLNASVQDNAKKTAVIQKHLSSGVYSSQSSAVLNLDCGGLIKLPGLPSSGGVLIVDYKSTQAYENNERCLWLLDSTLASGNRYRVQLKVTLLSDGFSDSGDVFSVLAWNSWDSIATSRLTSQSGTHTSQYQDYQYLSFTSNGASTGTGFVAKIEIIGQSLVNIGVNYAYTASPGSATYGPHKVNDRIGIVINPPRGKLASISVDYVDSRKSSYCTGDSSLYVFEIGEGGVSNKLGNLCGINKGSPRVYSTTNPIVVGYVACSHPRGEGFRITWK